MTHPVFRSATRLLGTCALALAAAGCDEGDAPPVVDAGPADARSDAPADSSADAPERAPPLRNRVELDDQTLAEQALAIIQAPQEDGSTYCGQCHGITRQTIRHWRALTDTALSSCLTDLDVRTPDSAAAMIRCLRGGTDGGNFEPGRLGVLSTAVNLDWFRYLTRRGVATDAAAAHTAFAERVVMPPPPTPTVTQPQFDVLAEWFIRGVPHLDDLITEDPRPMSCTQGISADVGAHVRRMATEGWGAVNRERNLLMHGCTGAARPVDCFATAPSARDTAYGRTWDVVPGTRLRVLHTTDYSSAYWTRTSADGRFVSHGARTSAPAGRFIDLQAGRVIPANGNYDPAFFADNSGFVFHATGAVVCEQSVLSTGTLARLTFTEPQCRRNGAIGLYEHVGAALEGGDYWSVDMPFESDDGGHAPTLRDPRAPFTATSRAKLALMTNTGAGFTQQETFNLVVPYEGDSVMSPSSRLVVTRVAGMGSNQLGFVVRRLDVTRDGSDITVALPEIGRYCINGSKATLSYDERWMILHHYVTRADAMELGFEGDDDPAFEPYLTRGGANVYLVDLLTGARTRLTNVQPGQYALFPHFRSDGWIYFMVRTAGTTSEYVVASDAALVMAAR